MQKFNKGDLVRVQELDASMRHFPSNCDAIVIGSCEDAYGCDSSDDDRSYSLFIRGQGEISWYEGQQLVLLESNKYELLQAWKDEMAVSAKQQSNLDWIFAHGKEVLESASGATVRALANNIGITNLWGGCGEGVTYYVNALQVLQLAKHFLQTSDKEGWLTFATAMKSKLAENNDR